MFRLTQSLGFLLAASFVAGNALPLLSQTSRPPLAVAALQEDFDVLQHSIEEAHGGFDRFAARDDVKRRLAGHRARLDRPLSHAEFAGRISEALAELRDGHARLELDSGTAASLASARVFPLRLAMENERLVVRYNDAQGNSTIVPGMEIVSINGRSATEIIRTLWPKIAADGFIETGKRHRLGSQFPTLHWLYVEQPDSYSVTARDAQGKHVAATLPGIVESERRNVVNPVNATFVERLAGLDAPPGTVSLEFLDNPRIARLRVRSFGGQGFVATLDSVLRVLKERGATTLILDLRGNGGGVDQYGARLVSYCTDRPFRYFDQIRITTIAPSFATWLPRTFEEIKAGTVPDKRGGFLITPALHSGVGEQQPAANGFKGRLFVLIDGASFSTTADVTAQLRSLKRAVFIGDETAGTYEGNTSGLNADIVLPNSRLKHRVMMYGYWNAVAPVPGGRGVIPDHHAPLRVSDVLAGRDPAMDLARTLAK